MTVRKNHPPVTRHFWIENTVQGPAGWGGGGGSPPHIRPAAHATKRATHTPPDVHMQPFSGGNRVTSLPCVVARVLLSILGLTHHRCWLSWPAWCVLSGDVLVYSAEYHVCAYACSRPDSGFVRIVG